MLRRVFRAIPFLLLLCTAGAARAQGFPEACENRAPKDPAYYADMKELPPGKLGFSYLNDRKQFDDPSVQVVLNSVGVFSKLNTRAFKLGCVEVWNRSTRVVRAVRLRWDVRARALNGDIVEDGEVLAKGLLSQFAVEVPAGESRRVEVRGVHFADFFQPLATAGEVNGTFHVTIGVARVEFTDGTSLDLP